MWFLYSWYLIYCLSWKASRRNHGKTVFILFFKICGKVFDLLLTKFPGSQKVNKSRTNDRHPLHRVNEGQPLLGRLENTWRSAPLYGFHTENLRCVHHFEKWISQNISTRNKITPRFCHRFSQTTNSKTRRILWRACTCLSPFSCAPMPVSQTFSSLNP